MFKKFIFYFPLSWLGFFLILISMYLLGTGYGSGNLYALIISLLSFILLILLLIVGYVLKLRFNDALISIETGKKITSRFENQILPFIVDCPSVPFFFLFYIQIKGKLYAGREASFSCFFESSFKTSSEQSITVEVPVYFPFCGNFDFETKVFIKDIFGILKIPLKKTEKNQILIFPPLFTEKASIQLLYSSAQESLRKIQTSDEEKYFMREYIPGDRLKDINWKSSIKINDLITRISPLSLEESPLIHLEIRPYHYKKNDGLQAILELNFLKSWILSFIKKLQSEHPNYKFHIHTGKEILLIENDQDFFEFEKKLTVLQFLNQEQPVETSYAMEKFIFSTGFDKKIGYFFKQTKSKLIVFRVVRGEKRKVKLYPFIQFSILPGWWIFRREISDFSSPKPVQGKLVEESVKLIYF